MSNIPGFGKTNVTMLMALALTIGLVLSVGPAAIVAPGNTIANFLGGDRACKDTGWEVDVKLHSIDMVGKQNVPYSQGFANCGGAQEIDFDVELTKQIDKCFEPLVGADTCLSDNKMWNFDKSGYSNVAISFSNLRKAYENCDESRSEAPLESRTVERGGVTHEYDYHVFCFDVRIKTDADMIRYTTWEFEPGPDKCQVLNPENGKRITLDSKSMDFLVHETSFRLADLCVDKAPDIMWENQGLWGADKWEKAVASNTAPPCMLLGKSGTPFPECEGKRFDGSLFVQFDVDEWNLDPNSKGDEGYHIGIMGAYLNDMVFGKEKSDEGFEANPNKGKFISDFEAESEFEGALGKGGTRISMYNLDKRGSPSGCLVFNTCDANFDGRGVASSQSILIELPVELMPAMYYEVNCKTGWFTVDTCRVDHYATINGFVDFTVRVDVISTGGFEIQDPAGEGPVKEPVKGEEERKDADYYFTSVLEWIQNNAILALAIWFIFVISLVVVKFLVKTTPIQVIK